jgi:hypothetical protein
VGQGAENMKSHCELHERDALCDTNSYNEMEYRLKFPGHAQAFRLTSPRGAQATPPAEVKP